MSEPIRVLQVIGIMNRGGAETMIMNMYRHIDRNRVQFDFVENENDGAYFDDEIRSLGGHIYHCPRFSGKNLFSYKKWWKAFFDANPEYSVVHGHIGSTAAIYLKEAKKHGILTIAHSHNISAKDSKQFLYDILSRPTRNIADYLFMCSRQAGIDRYGIKAVSDPGRAFLIPNAIDTEQFRFNEESRQLIRRELNISANTLLVGHVGRFAEQKNHDFLLDIFREIIISRPDAKLLLVGDGHLRSRIEKKINDLELDNKVLLAGIRSDVYALLSGMDVFVFPSKYEGLGISYIEAQCSGLPCVISDTIPSEGKLVEKAVTVLSLQDKASLWAESILNCSCDDRSAYADIVKEAGFDIVKNAEWLEEFYLERAK